MSDDKIPYEELQEKFIRDEVILDSLRRGEIDIVVGSAEPLIVRLKAIAEEKERLGVLLDIVRRINQLIIHEDNPGKLLKSAGDCLCEKELFNAARIVQLDESGKIIMSVENGEIAFKENSGVSDVKSQFPCLEKLIKSREPFVITEPNPACDEFVFGKSFENRCLIGVTLHHDKELFGAMIVSAPLSMATETDARKLCDEIGGELGFALFRIRNQAALKQDEAERSRLITAIEQTDDIVVITASDGTIEYVNPIFENITGYTSVEALGKTSRMLKSGKQDQAFYKDLWETITSGQTWKGRMVNKCKDGTLYTEESTITPVRDVSGQIVNFVAVKRNITENLRTNEEKLLLKEQLQQAQKLESVGRLAGGLAHDINNMLSIILGYGENLLHQLHYEDPMRDDVEEILDAGKRSATLTRQLLAFSRKQTLQPEVLDLNAVVRNLEKMLSRLIGEDINLELSLSDEINRVMADSSQIEQVIMNLAVNARDSMPKGGMLLIETSNIELDEIYTQKHAGVKPGRYVMLSVTDNGCGMDKEILSQVFEPFFTTKEKNKGTGLGLSMVYGIIKQSGGNIWAYSEPGHGTTFKIYLPQTNVKQNRKKAAAEKKITAGSGEHILVVEDEGSLRKLMETILSQLGYKVCIAANGGEALHLIEEKMLEPDLIITDVIMPNMSGRELMDQLRRNRPDLKVLYMSGYTNNAIAHHGVLDPGTPFIQKPFTLRDIDKKIREIFQGGVEDSR